MTPLERLQFLRDIFGERWSKDLRESVDAEIAAGRDANERNKAKLRNVLSFVDRELSMLDTRGEL